MSYKVTKPGLVSVLYLIYALYCIVVYQDPFLCIVSFRCYVFCVLVVLVKLSIYHYLPSDWLERLLWGSLTMARGSSPEWFSRFIVLLHCCIMFLCCLLPLCDIFPTFMAQYSLFVLKVPLNPKQTNKHHRPHPSYLACVTDNA